MGCFCFWSASVGLLVSWAEPRDPWNSRLHWTTLASGGHDSEKLGDMYAPAWIGRMAVSYKLHFLTARVRTLRAIDSVGNDHNSLLPPLILYSPCRISIV
ncbi:hypothetical protein BC629DRAFT_334579 [Irpex lacteus]|nr:hypothetical protein BC629DRAFT_334579 [Irpex lacteus]